MATVYHAYDPSFERDVAIKVLPPAFLHDPQLRARFEREAKMIAMLEHPAIVPVYDFGDQDGQPYIVMRFMAGGSLADRLKTGAMSLEETTRLISRLAPSLDAAHARGIIHRDIKPGNVLFDQYGNAFLSDFGIARLAEASGGTLTGESIVGTPAYMSPEQVQGDKAIDGRSDIYAMGVLVYQILTGQAPYQADTPAKVMLMHILEPVPSILEMRLDLPEGCQEIIAHAMAKDPCERFSTTSELADSLESLLSGKVPIKPPRAPAIEQTLISGQTVVSAPKTPRPLIRAQAGSQASATVVSATPRMGPAAPSLSPPVSGRKLLVPILIVALLLVGGAIAVGAYLLLGRAGQPLAAAAPVKASATQAYTATMLPPSATQRAEATTALPLAIAATSTPVPPTDTPTPTLEPTLTPTPQPLGPVIGGADMIAYLSGSDVWVAFLDGSGLQQLTQDGAAKSSLQWTPDGQALTYITGKCIQRVDLESAQTETITCFNSIDSLKSFDISPDGTRIALTIDNQMYIVPFDLDGLRNATNRNALTDMAQCKDFAPFLRNFITQVRWSTDSNTIAAKLIANLGDGRQGDIVQLFRVDECIPNPRALDNFPPPRFDMPGYDKSPVIQNFSWDGVFLFALNTIVRNDGFGDLYVYNTDLKKAYPVVNPVDAICCYRDPQWSPDGTHLLFAYQNYLSGSSSTTQLYYIPYGSVGSNAKYDPLPLPDITNPRERPLPVLRPAR